jgi:UDP-N-acetylglucosamine acyltransferase
MVGWLLVLDKTACIDPTAELDPTVRVGPYCIVGPRVKIGANTHLHSHVVIQQDTDIGASNVIYPFASIGSDPQYLDYKGEQTRLVIGDNNRIRESVTISRASSVDGLTQVGSNNYLMAYTHVAHDCVVGNNVIFANMASIAGFVEIGDYAFLGAFSGVHQFCKVGEYSFLGRATKVVQDILPYVIVAGNPGSPHSLNLVGLRRQGFTNDKIQKLKRVLNMFIKDQLPVDQIKAVLIEMQEKTPEVQLFLKAIESSTRGLAR